MAEKEYSMERLGGQKMRRYGPRPDSEPEGICPLCEAVMKAGDWTTLAAFRPTESSPEDFKAMIEGRCFNAPAVEIHWTCASKLPK